MKSFITSLVIAAFIVAGSIAYGMHIDKISSELVTINARLMHAIEAEDFENADNYFVIGFTGSGNGICIETDTGRIVWVDTDKGGIHLINSIERYLYTYIPH